MKLRSFLMLLNFEEVYKLLFKPTLKVEQKIHNYIKKIFNLELEFKNYFTHEKPLISESPPIP
jgi:hypothetical protein